MSITERTGETFSARLRRYTAAMARGGAESALEIARRPCPSHWPEHQREPWAARRDIARLAAQGNA